jgi:uncharacterized Zn finger protein (UPF0148 family)
MPGLEDRIDAVAGLGALELHSPREMNGLSAPMEEDSAAEVQRKERAAQMDRASALIGQRMLQGWAMLDLSCPQCYSPIMRDRQRQLWCVSCDMRVVDESEQAATTTAGGDSKQETSGQAPTPKRKSSPEVVTEASMEHSQGNAEDIGRGAKRQARDAALSVQLPNQVSPCPGWWHQISADSFSPRWNTNGIQMCKHFRL